jgi:rubredoxin
VLNFGGTFHEKSSEVFAAMGKHRCSVCGHIYDPAKGDRTQRIPPGTPFKDLPEKWVCPECGSPKAMYRKV